MTSPKGYVFFTSNDERHLRGWGTFSLRVMTTNDNPRSGAAPSLMVSAVDFGQLRDLASRVPIPVGGWDT